MNDGLAGYQNLFQPSTCVFNPRGRECTQSRISQTLQALTMDPYGGDLWRFS